MTTYILIHGSFHGAWNWHKIVPLIQHAGNKAIAIDMPGHGLDSSPLHKVTLQDCVDKVIRLIDSLDGKIVMLAHSRNGIVISQVAEARSYRIKRLIYLAAYLVPHGKSMMDYGQLDTDSLVYQNVQPLVNKERVDRINRLYKHSFLRLLFNWIVPSGQKTHKLDPNVYREALYHDCSDDITELAKSLLTAEPNFPGFEPLALTADNYGSVPKTYIECLQDRAVSLKLQRLMQQDCPCDDVYQLESGHSPFFSMPKDLVEVLLKYQ